MKRALALCCALGVASLSGGARADDDVARRAIPASAAAVLTLRPIAVAGALHRLGSGWTTILRAALSLPMAVNPLDPALTSTLGIDATAPIYAAVELLHGQAHLRVAAALSDVHLAEALVQTAATVAGVSLVRGGKGVWQGQTARGELVLARLDGARLVIDVSWPAEGSTLKVAQLAHLIPLQPVHAFDASRGTARGLSANDAVALWVDLAAAAQLTAFRDEQNLRSVLRHAPVEMRATIEKQGRAELVRCHAATRTLPATFDDLLLAVTLHGVDRLAITATLGGTTAALAKLHGAPVRPARTLPLGDEPFLRLDVVDAAPLRAALHLPAKGALPFDCGGPSFTVEALRRGPALLSARSEQSTGDASLRALLRVLAGQRGGTLLIAPDPAPVGSRLSIDRVVVVTELDDLARGDLDRLLAHGFDAAAPLKVGPRAYTAYSPPQLPWSTGEGPIVVVGEDTAGTVTVAFGSRERLRTALEHLAPLAIGASSAIAHASASGRGLERGAMGEDLRSVTDGVEGFDATLRLDDDALRLELDLALKQP